MDQMKTRNSLIFMLAATLVLGISCGGGDNQPTPNSQAQNGAGQSSAPTIQVPTIDESSITCDMETKTIYFHGTRPAGTRFEVEVYGLGDATEVQQLDVLYNAIGKFFYAYLVDMQPGATYTYSIIGYDSKGKESIKSAENTFTMPKNPSPQPPVTSGIQAYAPSTLHGTDGYLEGEVITTAMEYSTDGGETWTAVTEAGFIRNLAPGKVQLRWAETPTTEAGMAAEVKVPEYHSNTDPEGTGGSSEGMRAKRDVIR